MYVYVHMGIPYMYKSYMYIWVASLQSSHHLCYTSFHVTQLLSHTDVHRQ